MRKIKNNVYLTTEQKLKALEDLKTMHIADVGIKYNCSETSLYRWRDMYKKGGFNLLSGTGFSDKMAKKTEQAVQPALLTVNAIKEKHQGDNDTNYKRELDRLYKENIQLKKIIGEKELKLSRF